MDADLSIKVGALLIKSQIDAAAKVVEDKLLATGSARFTSLLTSRFTNPPQSVLKHINGFLMTCQTAFDIKAIYLPHNGLVFNSDRWYFDSNAYDVIHDLDKDYEWLCHPKPIEWEAFTLTGLEPAQDDFAWYVDEEMFENENWETIADLAELLVKVRFAQLIASTLSSGPLTLSVPVITTAYGPDFFCRFDPEEK
jgi:hypothetical protein